MIPLSCVILTHNEEANLTSCLESLREVTDDIHVLDSGSTDSTVAIAQQRGASIHSNRFTGFGDQRNWAIDHLPHKYPWSFHLDADERFTPTLAAEIGRLLQTSPIDAGFHVPSKLMLGNQWLRYSSGYPVYQVRLFHCERLRFENDGHGQREVASGPIGFLKEPYLHYAFSKGIEDWFVKHARYARLEAMKYGSDTKSNVVLDLKSLFSHSTVERRRSLKQLSHRLPLRRMFRVFYLLIIKRGILDGTGGITYAKMMGIYEDMTTVFRQIDAKSGNGDLAKSPESISNET